MKNNVFILPLILILLFISLGLGIVGLIQVKQEETAGSNPNHEHKFNGNLYYYDNNNLLGTYTCLNDTCSDAETITNDEYLYIVPGTVNTLSNISNEYALVKEDNLIKLVKINGNSLRNFKSIKNYGLINAPFYVIEIEDGVFSAMSTTSISTVIDEIYSYVGYINKEDVAGTFAVSKDSKFYLIQNKIEDDQENIKTVTYNDPIYYYTSRFVITKKNNTYKIYDYYGKVLKGNINGLEISGDYIIAKGSFNSLAIYNNTEKLAEFNDKSYTYEITDEGININSNGVLIETVK